MMVQLTENQPNGTPAWIDLGIPDLDRAMEFYNAVFGWDFAVSGEEFGRYTVCLLRGLPVAALAPTMDQESTTYWWNMYFAADDCDATVQRAVEAGGTVVLPTTDIPGQGLMAMVIDPAGGQFGVWQGAGHLGCNLVNEPGALIRNDLVTPQPNLARPFYASVFDFTLDGNDDLPDLDFTFLRRPDGHEIGGVVGVPDAPKSSWTVMFAVSDVDAVVTAARGAGGTATDPADTPYARTSTVTDPFGAEFTVGSNTWIDGGGQPND